eukprot:3383496-Pyramimonas_sp.AAC.1
MKKLEKLGITCIEMPLIEHAHGKDRKKLGSTLKAGKFDWAVVTSPEGAKVFLEGTVSMQRFSTPLHSTTFCPRIVGDENRENVKPPRGFANRETIGRMNRFTPLRASIHPSVGLDSPL